MKVDQPHLPHLAIETHQSSNQLDSARNLKFLGAQKLMVFTTQASTYESFLVDLHLRKLTFCTLKCTTSGSLKIPIGNL